MFASPVEQMEFILRVMDDESPQETADAVLLYSQTLDNEGSILQRALELLRRGLVKKAAICQGGRLQYGPSWTPLERLVEIGIPKSDIICVPLTAEIMHTHIEAVAFVAYANVQGWKNVYSTAPPFHEIRVFAETITMVLRDYPQLKAYSMPGTHLRWTEKAVHSQNIATGTRAELLKGELKRLEDYFAKGDLASARQVLDYLNRRDA